tara:strand:+ start:358 stop:675 length:318 start_codon:yes stop_codon:yes gene_type:complete
MEIKKVILLFFIGIFLTSCVQTTAMVGPSITLISTGNVSQAGAAFFTNKAVKEETGMDTMTLVSSKLEEQNKKNRIKRELKEIVKSNFKKTREILILQDQSNIFK